MKFATLEHSGQRHVGVLGPNADTILPIDTVDLIELLARAETLEPSLMSGTEFIPLAEVRLLAPMPEPRRNIFCVGKNYRGHAEESSRSGCGAGVKPSSEPDAYPAVFTKPASSVVGPEAPVPTHPNVSAAVDYEGELAAVIGHGRRDIARADAMRHVFGFTIINDVTARDLQKNHTQRFLGKGLDGFCPMGPWITTCDEIVPNDLLIQT
jgi:2-keto-4-pentenoate hydratase/2-oxohepta-3-ene-1,7-dioic acid hydratase in catechol pathway